MRLLERADQIRNGTWGINTASNFTVDPSGQTGLNISASSLDTVHFSAGTDATGSSNVSLGGSRDVCANKSCTLLPG